MSKISLNVKSVSTLFATSCSIFLFVVYNLHYRLIAGDDKDRKEIMLQRNWLQLAYKTVSFALIKTISLNVFLVNFCYSSFVNYEFDRMVGDALSCFEAETS